MFKNSYFRLTVQLKKLILMLTFTIQASAFGQIERGRLLQDSLPTAIAATYYQENGQLNLEELRSLTDFITNRDVSCFQGLEIPKRPKALLRHVKQVNEHLETSYQDNTSRNDSLDDILYELVLIFKSLKQNTIQESLIQVLLRQKVQMLTHTVKSRWTFRYKIPEKSESLIFTDHINSPFYHNLDSTIPLHKQFDYLAKKKKIKIKDDMVVILKTFSMSGSAPKVKTFDLDLDNEWMLKWGDEAHTDVVSSRIFASLGYDVDHPYFFEKDKVTLILESYSEVQTVDDLVQRLLEIYSVDLKPFISEYGEVTSIMALSNEDLLPFIGRTYVRFTQCFLEARPDRVKRIGSFLPYEETVSDQKAIKGSLLAHHFIGNWDTREANTLLTTVHDGNYNYRISAVFSDLGTSLGVRVNMLPPDFKVGLVNEFPWEIALRKRNKIILKNAMNAILPSYYKASYEDLLWMAHKIAGIDEFNLFQMISEAHWPKAIEMLYFHKLASRRASILSAFEIEDPHPIPFDKKLNIIENGVTMVRDGELILDFTHSNPVGFLEKKGRKRNYGN